MMKNVQIVFLLFLLFYFVDASAKDIYCFTCSSSLSNPLKCTKPEYLWTYKQCKEETLAPANTCFKSVDTKTGEVNKGCSHPQLSIKLEGSVETFYCNSRLCNAASCLMPQWLGYVVIVLCYNYGHQIL